MAPSFFFVYALIILIVSLNTTSSHFFMDTPTFHKMLSWKFGLKSWKCIGQHVDEPVHWSTCG